MLQNATPLRKSEPWPPNISDERISCTAPATRHASLQILFKSPMLANVFEAATKPSCVAHFWQGAQSLAPAGQKRHLNVQKCSVPVSFFYFDFDMCFAPQQRALFRCLNFRKGSNSEVLCTFWLRHVLCATAACTAGIHFFNVSTSKSAPNLVLCTFWLRNVLRARTACNVSSLIWPDGSSLTALASLLFDLPEPQIIQKTKRSATFLPFPAPASSFFWLFLFSDLLSSSLLFSDSSRLCFSICPYRYCRKFDFKTSFQYIYIYIYYIYILYIYILYIYLFIYLYIHTYIHIYIWYIYIYI